MKKFFLVILLVSTFCAFSQVQKIDPTQLPEKTQIFLQTAFKDAHIVKATTDASDAEPVINVVLSNGSKVTFNQVGKWQKMETKKATLPTYVIPDAFLNYCTTTYPDEKIIKIEKTNRKNVLCFEVVLSNKTTVVWNAETREVISE